MSCIFAWIGVRTTFLMESILKLNLNWMPAEMKFLARILFLHLDKKILASL